MREIIFEFVNQYAMWGILIVAFFSAIILIRMSVQLKRLNRNLSSVTGKVQEYFNAIMAEEPKSEPLEEPRRMSARENWREEKFLTKEERDMLLGRKNETTPEDEEVFQAVLQEYFT